MTEIKLPPLPTPDADHYDNGTFAPVWKKGKMGAYARAAIEADRQANQITGETSDGYHTFNELYAHRVRLFCLLMHAHKSNAWWSRKHHDGSAWEGWVIAGIDTPEGHATYHLPESEIENLPDGIELPNGKEWDGHTAADVLVRLLSLRQARSEPVASANPVLHTQILTLRKYQAWRTGEDARTMDDAGIVPAAVTSALEAVLEIAEDHLRGGTTTAAPNIGSEHCGPDADCCDNQDQCWEPCGDLGNSMDHAAVAPKGVNPTHTLYDESDALTAAYMAGLEAGKAKGYTAADMASAAADGFRKGQEARREGT